MEIERKFLVNQLPDLKLYPHKNLTQAYISTDPVIRIRKMNNSFSLCVKSQGHLIREEFELELTHEQYQSLWPKVEHSPVKKVRYFIPLDDDLTAELDVYNEHLEGLITVEVEFNSTGEASNFVPPSWFGLDITHDNRYKNNHLSIYGLPV